MCVDTHLYTYTTVITNIRLLRSFVILQMRDDAPGDIIRYEEEEKKGNNNNKRIHLYIYIYTFLSPLQMVNDAFRGCAHTRIIYNSSSYYAAVLRTYFFIFSFFFFSVSLSLVVSHKLGHYISPYPIIYFYRIQA